MATPDPNEPSWPPPAQPPRRQQAPPQWQQVPPPGYYSPYSPQALPQQAAGPNVAAIIALVSGLVGILILPIILGPVALISGVVGHSVARHRGVGEKMSLAGILLGVRDLIWAAYPLGLVT